MTKINQQEDPDQFANMDEVNGTSEGQTFEPVLHSVFEHGGLTVKYVANDVTAAAMVLQILSHKMVATTRRRVTLLDDPVFKIDGSCRSTWRRAGTTRHRGVLVHKELLHVSFKDGLDGDVANDQGRQMIRIFCDHLVQLPGNGRHASFNGVCSRRREVPPCIASHSF